MSGPHPLTFTFLLPTKKPTKILYHFTDLLHVLPNYQYHPSIETSFLRSDLYQNNDAPDRNSMITRYLYTKSGSYSTTSGRTEELALFTWFMLIMGTFIAMATSFQTNLCYSRCYQNFGLKTCFLINSWARG